MHELINVEHNPTAKKLRKWSGQCKCRRWQGAAKNEKQLYKIWQITHLKTLI
jgi:hypothetical protein